MKKMIKYLFADRDGTLIFDKHYLCNPDEVELIPNVANALKALQDKQIQCLVVTNQSGIGRGYFTETELFACQDTLQKQLSAFDIQLLDMAYCSHSPEENCDCRKPRLGMWKELAERHGLNPHDCAMVGDKKEDVLFGIHAGFACSCLVLTGKGEKTAQERGIALENGKNILEIDSAVFGVAQNGTRCFVARTMQDFCDFLLDNEDTTV